MEFWVRLHPQVEPKDTQRDGVTHRMTNRAPAHSAMDWSHVQPQVKNILQLDWTHLCSTVLFSGMEHFGGSNFVTFDNDTIFGIWLKP